MHNNEVRLIQFEGKNGAFATSLVTLYRVELVNMVTKLVRHPHADHYSSQQSAYEYAREWAMFLGCHVVQYKEVETVSKSLVKKHA